MAGVPSPGRTFHKPQCLSPYTTCSDDKRSRTFANNRMYAAVASVTASKLLSHLDTGQNWCLSLCLPKRHGRGETRPRQAPRLRKKCLDPVFTVCLLTYSLARVSAVNLAADNDTKFCPFTGETRVKYVHRGGTVRIVEKDGRWTSRRYNRDQLEVDRSFLIS